MTSDGSGAALRAVMYGEDDLSSWSIFSGHFINFGYWQNFTAGQHLTIDDRTASQADLYRTVLRRAGVGPSDSLVEVGCGIGVGAALALSFENQLRAAGFVDVRIEAIGELVWPGCDAWRAQTEYSEEWGRNWLKAYRAGLIDYYIAMADKAATTD